MSDIEARSDLEYELGKAALDILPRFNPKAALSKYAMGQSSGWHTVTGEFDATIGG